MKVWHGLLISPWVKTQQGGDPKFRPQGVPRIMTPSEIYQALLISPGLNDGPPNFFALVPKINLHGTFSQ